ncbi:MAG TPA: FliH/SctL family protein [Polyangiaceae bacterium]|nr:FliH/SctL family protein [Polyangiaceae bacterium]
MSTPRARIIRSPELAGAARLLPFGPSAPLRRRIARDELEGRLAAERLVEAARREAQEVVARAREQAAELAAGVEREARQAAQAELCVAWMRLRREEGERLERDTDRVVAVAVVLAERLLGAALALDPRRIVDLARVALAEARGARRLRLQAHPLDADLLGSHLAGAGLADSSVEVVADETLARGELRLQTDVGTIDGKLSARLERLAAALRDALT